MMKDHIPLIKQTINAVEEWGKNKPLGKKLPQRLGNSTLVINDRIETRYNLSYSYFMVQRIQEQYALFTAAEKTTADDFLQSINQHSIIQTPLRYKTALKFSRLHLA